MDNIIIKIESFNPVRISAPIPTMKISGEVRIELPSTDANFTLLDYGRVTVQNAVAPVIVINLGDGITTVGAVIDTIGEMLPTLEKAFNDITKVLDFTDKFKE